METEKVTRRICDAHGLPCTGPVFQISLTLIMGSSILHSLLYSLQLSIR